MKDSAPADWSSDDQRSRWAAPVGPQSGRIASEWALDHGLTDAKISSATDVPPDGFGARFRRLCGFPQETRTGGSNLVSAIRVDQPAHEKIVPGVPDIVLRLVHDGDIGASTVDRGGSPKSLSGRKGGICVAPAHAEAAWRSDSDHTLLMVAAPQTHALKAFIGAGAARAGDDPISPIYDKDIFDPKLARMMEALWSEAGDAGPAATLTVEGRATSILGRLLHLPSERRANGSERTAAALDVKRLRRVIAYVEDNIQDTITIDDLARIAGRSPFHFARCFRAATGASPHRFVLARRVGIARRLLADTDEAVAEIAYRCGFSSQAHLSTAFRKQIGSTPGA